MLTWSLNSFASAIAAELPLHVREIEKDAQATDARRAAFARALEAMGARVMPSHAPFLLADFGRDMTEVAKGCGRGAFWCAPANPLVCRRRICGWR